MYVGDPKSEYYMEYLSHYNKEIIKFDFLNKWKIEILKYYERDCLNLYRVISKFKILIFKEFKVNIYKYVIILYAEKKNVIIYTIL